MNKKSVKVKSSSGAGVLKLIYQEDLKDRKQKLWEKNLKLFTKRDEERLVKVLAFLKKRRIIAPADYLYAALILQHGNKTRHYELAHQLAKKAAEMGYRPKKGELDPLWLAAAAKDRSLMSQGKSQLYGTQFRKDSKGGPWMLHDVDPNITDEERARWHVPPLKDAIKKVQKLNRLQ